jgi:CxxC motif-containing protein (DUF1111 family)
MHDGITSTRQEATQRHAGQIMSMTDAFHALTTEEQNQIIGFLDSL